jgi:hypothetical protein
MNYNKEQLHDMYLDWFNNYLSTEKFAEDYNLSMAETENVLDMGRKIQEAINIRIEEKNIHTEEKNEYS